MGKLLLICWLKYITSIIIFAGEVNIYCDSYETLLLQNKNRCEEWIRMQNIKIKGQALQLIRLTVTDHKNIKDKKVSVTAQKYNYAG